MTRLILCVFLLIPLSGCIEKKIIDDINIITGVGFDQSGGQMIGTFLTQNFKPDKSIINQTFTSKATLRRDLLIKANKQSPQPLVTGGLAITVIGEELGKRGIKDILDVYQRDVSIGARNFFATAEGKAETILKGEYGTIGSGNHLYNLLDNNIKSKDLPKMNLQLLLRDYYQKGKDIYLPRLKKTSATQVEISGLSLFKEDKVVTDIPIEKLFFFKLLVDKYSKGNFSIPKETDAKASIRSIQSKHIFKIAENNPSHLTIQIKIKGAVQEYTGKKLVTKDIKKIQKELEKEVEKECLQLVKQFQQQNIDPIGLGHFYKSRNRGFDYKKWEADYQNLQVKIICHVVIEGTSIIS
ncbi:Ger(x)C family spore germination protein [Bacillus sp. S3]|uniref:Ger(x)C family spore germination protein n=1 Tax=Bacillus sp. S3 TaxID=486398 RepID=UPI00118B69AD|nr:Ger(x)C family spore germination protein [Bacillus sp. S3]QCJ44656.1 Ger(x)C family spore germination protein [Bacillus sp. S3]